MRARSGRSACAALVVALVVAGCSGPGPLSMPVVGGRLIGALGLEIVPTGASGSLTLDSIRGAILMALADPASGAIVESRRLNLTIHGTGDPRSISIHFVPGRCEVRSAIYDYLVEA